MNNNDAVFAEFVIPGLGTIMERVKISSAIKEYRVPIHEKITITEANAKDAANIRGKYLLFELNTMKKKDNMVLAIYELKGVENL